MSGTIANCPELPLRLATLAGLLPPAGAVADIGSGHGRLAAYLAQRGTPKVIAVDVARGACDEIDSNLRRWNMSERVEVRCGDGFAVLRHGEVDGAVVAGVGGHTMVQICAAAAGQGLRWLALQPMQRAPVVASWLIEHGWQILSEATATQRGRAYPTWVAVPN